MGRRPGRAVIVNGRRIPLRAWLKAFWQTQINLQLRAKKRAARASLEAALAADAREAGADTAPFRKTTAPRMRAPWSKS